MIGNIEKVFKLLMCSKHFLWQKLTMRAVILQDSSEAMILEKKKSHEGIFRFIY